MGDVPIEDTPTGDTPCEVVLPTIVRLVKTGSRRVPPCTTWYYTGVCKRKNCNKAHGVVNTTNYNKLVKMATNTLTDRAQVEYDRKRLVDLRTQLKESRRQLSITTASLQTMTASLEQQSIEEIKKENADLMAQNEHLRHILDTIQATNTELKASIVQSGNIVNTTTERYLKVEADMAALRERLHKFVSLKPLDVSRITLLPQSTVNPKMSLIEAEEYDFKVIETPRWQWESDDGWSGYNEFDSHQIENHKESSSFPLFIHDRKYDICKSKMIQKNCVTGYIRRIRRLTEPSSVPKFYTQDVREKFTKWKLPYDSDEFKFVQSQCNLPIDNIVKCCNRPLLEAYCLQRSHMKNKAEILAFHGTRLPEAVLDNGPKLNMAREGYLGRGFYISDTASYASRYYSSDGRVVALFVSIGAVQYCDQDTSRTGPDMGYDSCKFRVDEPDIRAVYNAAQAYAAYIITPRSNLF